MAKKWVRGKTAEEIDELKSEYDGDIPFDEQHCLIRIPRQPDDYDGPQRYCSKNRWTESDGGYCYSHRTVENLTPGNMKHGLRALRENFRADFSQDEQDAYDEIVEVWKDYYDIDDPSSIDTLESMATEIVREIRADRMIERHKDSDVYTDEGLTHIKENFGPDGAFLGTERVPDHIVEYRQKARRLAQKLKKDLGITRRHQDRMDAESSKAETLEAIGESVSSSLEGGTYDPEEFSEDSPDGESGQ